MKQHGQDHNGISAPASFWREKTLICLAVLLSYASVWPNRFLFDDYSLIVNNRFLRSFHGLLKIFITRNTAGADRGAGFYRPVPMVFDFFVYQLFGPSTIAFHALSLALQALNGCLLLTFGLRAGFNRYAALAAALLWAVHPLHTEAVAYMSSTPELIWSMFCLLGLITLLPKEMPANGIVDQKAAFTPRKIKLSLLFFIPAMLSKESAVVFPALATATLFFISPARKRLATYFKTAPLWLVAYAYILVIVLFILKFSLVATLNPAVEHLYQTHLAVRLWTALATLPAYARLILWPAGLHFRRATPVFTTFWNPRSLIGLAIVLAAVLQILWGRGKKGLALSFGLLWFGAALAPDTGIVTPVDGIISEHWMYLPTMGLFLGVAQSLSGPLGRWPKAAFLLALVLAVASGAATFRQNEVWRNIDTLYQNTQRHHGSLRILSCSESMFLISHRRFAAARQSLRYCRDNLPKEDAYDRVRIGTGLAMAWLEAVPQNGTTFTVADVRRALPAARHIGNAIAELQTIARLYPARSYWAHRYLAAIYTYRGAKTLAAKQEEIARQLKNEGTTEP